MGRIIAALLLAVTVEAWASVTVTLTAPPDGSIYTSPANIVLSADASAGQNYTVSEVQFYYGTTLIGADFSAPYSVTWTGAPAGQYSLTAKATAIKKNSPDQTATSSVVNITVNARPTAEITSPAAFGTWPIATPTVTLSANASDSDGTVAKVEFKNCGGTISPTFELIATVTQEPYTVQWTPPEPYVINGKYRQYGVSAQATDNLGATNIPGCPSFMMTPTTEITSPANGASYTAPAMIPLEVTLTPLAQTSANFTTVQFYHGTTLMGEKTAPPFTFNWENVPAGSYSVRAKMRSSGYEWWSAPVNVTVGAASAQLHYIHADHLNTPRLIADAAGTTVWRWDQQEPFGNNPADEDPDANSVAFDLPLRLPGQRYDKESNLHYNYYRDYDSGLGRYIQSDPVGLIGGLNTYIYAFDPTGQVDPRGLMGTSPGKGPYPPGQGPGTIPGYSCAVQVLKSTTFKPGASDKYKHCVVSCNIAVQCGSLTSMGAGVGKEVADLFGPGNAEWGDLVADWRGLQCGAKVKWLSKDPCIGFTCERCCSEVLP